MERAESPTAVSSGASLQDTPSVQVQDEPEFIDSPVTSPTTTISTSPNESAPAQHAKSTTAPAPSSSSSTLSQGPQKQTSTERPRRGHTHRLSSLEYKETLDATTRHLEDGSRIINQYRLQNMLGQGAYGNVYEACLLQDPSVKFAVKEFGKTRLRKTHRAAIMRKPFGRGGNRARGAFAARGARGGRPNEGGKRRDEPTHMAEDLSMMSLEGANDKGEKVSKLEANQERTEGADREDPLSLIRHEIAILKKLDHPHVVDLYEALDDPSKDGLYMVFEHCPDGRVIDVKLHEQAKPLDEECAREYLVQIMLGIEYLHFNEIVHRDIKPDNILLQDNRKTCKIVDFGVSEIFIKPGDDTLQKSAGSPAFMSPEMCMPNHGDFHGKKGDIWSLGVTFYCMVVGRLPFDKSQFLDMYDAIRNDDPEYPDHLSKDCRDLLERLLEKDPEERMTLSEMRQHPFMTKQGTVEITSEEQNTSAVVVEVTDEELDGAIKKISSVFTLARAISKFKRAGSRASSSGSMSDIDMADHLMKKGGMDSNKGAKGGKDDREGKREGVTKEHLAAAHIVCDAQSRANAAEDAAAAVLLKGRIQYSPEADCFPDEKKTAGGEESPYFPQKADEHDDGGDQAGPQLLSRQPVKSPVGVDLPSPKGASAAYKGLMPNDAKEK